MSEEEENSQISIDGLEDDVKANENGWDNMENMTGGIEWGEG